MNYCNCVTFECINCQANKRWNDFNSSQKITLMRLYFGFENGMELKEMYELNLECIESEIDITDLPMKIISDLKKDQLKNQIEISYEQNDLFS